MGRRVVRAAQFEASTAPAEAVVDPMQTLVIAITALVTTNVVAMNLGRERRRRPRRRD